MRNTGTGLRKGDFAATVRLNMPRGLAPGDRELAQTATYRRLILRYGQIRLDAQARCGIICLTGGERDETETKDKERGTPRQWMSPSPSRKGLRRELHFERVFRLARPPPDQVRDATTRSHRSAQDRSDRCRIRTVTPLLLPSTSRLRTQRVGGTSPEEAWSSQRTQTLEGGARCAARRVGWQARSELNRPCRARQRTFRFFSASEKCRALTGAPRKKKPSADTWAQAEVDDLNTLCLQHYEELRHRALETDTTGSRLGLAVLVSSGLAAWMKIWATVRVDLNLPPPENALNTEILSDDQCAPLVNVLAEMALSHLREATA